MFYFLQGHGYKTAQQTFGIGLCRASCTAGEQRNSSSAARKSHEQLFLWYFCLYYKASKLHQNASATHFWRLIANSLRLIKHMVWRSCWTELQHPQVHCNQFLSFWFFYWLELSITHTDWSGRLPFVHLLGRGFFSVLRSDLFVFTLHLLWHMVAINIVI